ncbi:MAG: DUF4254 domain-containing protein [Chitinophagaceae bacterium]
MISEKCISIFQQSIKDYHVKDDIDAAIENPFDAGSFDHLLYAKAWIDTVQWHLEDVIRDPQIDPVKALQFKRRIDESNQRRTDMVEYIDAYFLDQYKNVQALPEATINTESPAWAIDRLSILELKIYHMLIEATRSNASEEHRAACHQKLDVLLLQRKDLSTAINQLLQDIEAGRKCMKVYKQMKMYNDDSLNPVLYAQKN